MSNFFVSDTTQTPFTSGSAGVQIVRATATPYDGTPVGAVAGLQGNFVLDTQSDTVWACVSSGTSGSAQWSQLLLEVDLVNGSIDSVFASVTSDGDLTVDGISNVQAINAASAAVSGNVTVSGTTALQSLSATSATVTSELNVSGTSNLSTTTVPNASASNNPLPLGQAFQLIEPNSSITLTSNSLKTLVMPSGLSGAITLTLPNAVPAGTSYVIYGYYAYAVTVATSVSSGNPFIGLPDGSTDYSWVIPASDSSQQGIRLDFDGTNWRAQTFGQTVVAPATQSNAAVQLSQLFIGNRKAVFTSNGTFTVPAAVTTIWVSGTGGGGGGGGGNAISSGSQGAGGGGGAAGALVFKNNISVTPGEVLTVVIGSGGSGGAGVLSLSNAGNGTSGGTTTLSDGDTTLLSLSGGSGGDGALVVDNSYALGGSGFNPGFLSVATGVNSSDYGSQTGFGGSGQGTPFGASGSGGHSGSNGGSGSLGAGGGGGGGNTGSGTSNGGDGGSGIIIIEW